MALLFPGAPEEARWGSVLEAREPQEQNEFSTDVPSLPRGPTCRVPLDKIGAKEE